MRRALLALTLLAAGCRDAPDAPPPSGFENEAVTTPAERAFGAMEEGDVEGAEPGLPGTDTPAAAFSLDGGARCYVYDRAAVVVRPRPEGAGEDVTVVPAPDGATRALCDARGRPVSTPGEPDFFAGVRGDRLLLDRGTGPDGRSLRVLGLADGAVVAEADYTEPVLVEAGTARFGRLDARAADADALAATGATCPEAAGFFESGLGVAVVRAVRLDLTTGTVTPTDSTYCAPLQ